MDPEPDMLREAQNAARQRHVRNVEWVKGGAGELGSLASAFGNFDLVTVGTAFHFMDPHATLSDLQRLASGGAVAVAYNGSPMWLHADPWAKALRSVLASRLGRLGDADFTAEALRAAEEAMRDLGYVQIERWERTYAESINVDFIVGHMVSATSSDQIPAAQRADFAREVSAAIAGVAPSGQVVEHVSVLAVLGRTANARPQTATA
jgi:Methyltransferase domain